MMTLSELSTILNGRLTGADAAVTHFVIDSRTLQPTDGFFAIKGDVFDGHDFLNDVAAKKAAVAIVDRDVTLSIPTIRVENTKHALITLAKYFRDNRSIPVIGITGSCGKTTTRALIEAILKKCGNVLASQKSFNNDIGLPLTLFQLNKSHDFAVLEIGTNHPGEIAALTNIAKPTISVVTMVTAVHVEGFGSIEAIAKEKADIYEPVAIGIVNADDIFIQTFQQKLKNKKIISFGIKNNADVMAKEIQVNEAGYAQFLLVDHVHQQQVEIKLPLLGYHNITNALAAASIAIALNISLEKIKIGLETAAPEYGRLNIKSGLNNATIIDDSYNANPTSVKAAIDILISRVKNKENAIFIFGDMKELGEMAEGAHREIGVYAHQKGVQLLFCYGDQAKYTAEAFGPGAQHFSDQGQLISALRPLLTKDVTVLIKGSNSMKMVNIVNAITDRR